MNQKESNIQTAFILSIVAHGIFSLIGITASFFSFPNDTLTNMLLTFGVYPAPMVLGIISLSMNKLNPGDEIAPKFRVFRILARIFSSIAIVISAILTFVYLIILCFHV